MIKINASQLNSKLNQNDALRYFLAVGNDVYLQHITQDQIKNRLHSLGFEEQSVFVIDHQTDWDLINESTQAMSLFSNQILLILQFGDNGLNATTSKKLDELTQHLSSEVGLLISLPKLTKAQENMGWFKALADQLCIIACNTPDTEQLPLWVNQQLQQHSLIIEKQGIDLLCYYYEGNLLALSQLIEQLALLYPTGKISYSQVENNINDSAIFTPYHWIDAMLMSKTKRSFHILQQLKMNDTEPLILLRTLQRELILLINVKKKSTQDSLKIAYDLYKVWQNRRNLMTPYLTKTSLNHLYQILNQLTMLEITLKSDYQAPIWEKLNALNLLFIGSKYD